MARRYENGVIVGEPDSARTLPQIAKWCHDEWELAGQKREKEPRMSPARAYLSGRQAVLREIITMLEALQ